MAPSSTPNSTLSASTAWLGELIDATCTAPPMLIGQTLSGAIAATFASGEPTRISGLVLVDSLGLRPFEPAPEFGQALEGFLSRPDNISHDRLWKYCAFDLDGLCGEMADTVGRVYRVQRRPGAYPERAIRAVRNDGELRIPGDRG